MPLMPSHACIYCGKSLTSEGSEYGMPDERGVMATCANCFWGSHHRQEDGQHRVNEQWQGVSLSQLRESMRKETQLSMSRKGERYANALSRLRDIIDGFGLDGESHRPSIPGLFSNGQPRRVVVGDARVCNCNHCRAHRGHPRWVHPVR